MVEKIYDKVLITEEESELFRQAVKNVVPLIKKPVKQTSLAKKLSPPSSTSKQKPILKKIKILPQQLANISQKKIVKNFSFTYQNSDVKSQEQISFFRSGLPYREQIKLKRGHFKICARLDLHQLNLDQALHYCEEFILECQKNKIRHALIIHGKAQNAPFPILKNALNRWLRDQPAVLAFHSAKPEHGGSGATYIIIRALK